MHVVIPDLLWIGNASDARTVQPLLERDIAAVIDLAAEEPPAALPRHMIYCRFPLIDGGDNDPRIIAEVVRVLARLLGLQIRTLVACSAGASRAPTIAAFGVAELWSLPPEEGLRRVGAAKSLEVSPAFWNDVAQAMRRN